MKKRRNIHRSEQDWQAIFDHFNKSGLTQDVFCQQNQLAAAGITLSRSLLTQLTAKAIALLKPVVDAQ
ncbi:MAG: hypothetical protein CSA50_00845 [Gammaproteobacteria bacterium]|nr:MAG: hypothetical protein CSA50_00845 [Gammaproteobacteria bacterium]